MRTALNYTDLQREKGLQKPLYSAIYFDNNIRFQYPPSCLLILEALREYLFPRAIGDRFLNLVSWVSIWLLAGVVARVFFLARRRYGGEVASTPAAEALVALLICFVTLTFYPVVRGYYLGQIQVWIDLLIAVVIWTWLEGRRGMSGIVLSLVCVIKPTFALVIVWAVVRQHWDFVKGFSLPMSTFALISLVTFGWANHVDYLEVLAYISRQGEIFHPNQSMNGLLHRALGNGNSLEWDRSQLMTFNPWVYAGTLVTTIGLMGAGLYRTKERPNSERGLDLAVILVCATLASPTVWTHHYGVMLPIFALSLPAILDLDAKSRVRTLAWALLCFMLISNNFRALNRLSDTHFNVFQSYVFFAGIGYLAILWKLRASRTSIGR
jgi:alpha-1,2-mannosyltransferase